MGSFGNALKRLRGEVTQAELARLSGVPRGTIASLEGEHGKEPKWSTVVSLARGLGITTDTFSDAEQDATDAAGADAITRLTTLEVKADVLARKARMTALLADDVRALESDMRAVVEALHSAGITLPPLSTLEGPE